jgi:aminoglycoside phosphotransferase (APT) family kinase protein
MSDHYTIPIDTPLVQRLIAEQFPQWADLEIKPVELSGWDNKIFHLGAHTTVRLPSHAEYSGQVEKEQHWLHKLAAHIAMPLAMGQPSAGYPFCIGLLINGSREVLHRLNGLKI